LSEDIVVPVFPESINDGLLSAIYKKVGEYVDIGDVIADIETDKVMLEIPSPVAGVVEAVVEEEGTTVTSGQIIAKISPQLREEPKISNKVSQTNTSTSSDVKAVPSPSAEKIINENKIDVSKINGTGKDGRIIKEDVLSYLEQDKITPLKTPSIPSTPEIVIADERFQKRVPMSRIRVRIAERLLEAQQNAAILTTFNEVNMQAIVDLRKKYGTQFEKTHSIRLGFMSFFIKATVEALKQFPDVNASIEGDDIIYHGFVDMGIAIGSPRGLVVPIIRDIDSFSVANIEKIIVDFSERAKSGKLTLDDITGGTFSITNGGVFGSMLSTPILNPPQSGILGMHKIEKRAVVENDEIVIRPMMYLAFSYDHRIIDGSTAVKFLVTIKEELEDPARILLEI
jgi:2-oxoglutarate dehydrogenase E2 component (dihydrolipoamide succinyltransferase)